ncbi:MAG: SEC-C metal-binding domain-containing protein [Bdellovibrionota bacterium]
MQYQLGPNGELIPSGGGGPQQQQQPAPAPKFDFNRAMAAQKPRNMTLSHPATSRPGGALVPGGGGTSVVDNSTVSKVGRNDPCPCGSGKKYKKCHGTNS